MLGIFFLAVLEFTLAQSKWTIMDRVEKERELGKQISPPFTSQFFLERRDILPLSSPSKTEILLCKEAESEVTYFSDRYGFRNDDSIWNKSEWDQLILGDSYALGFCEEEYFSKDIPNLSAMGNGPLSQLATYIEYGAEKNPKKIILTLVSNDLGIDLLQEKENPILVDYLQGKEQFLDRKQKDLDKIYYEQESLVSRERKKESFEFINVFRKWGLKFLHLDPMSPGYRTDYQHQEFLDINLYLNVLSTFKKISPKSEFVILFIPDAFSFRAEQRLSVDQFVLNLKTKVESLGFRFLDAREAISNAYSKYNPLGGYYGHFNKEGHRELRDYLKRNLSL
ncbi:MAG: hypothetical protein M9962_11395 [Oligoflexia bacterium]|nr:hypothetical protein [Oligoflexia bacterium]